MDGTDWTRKTDDWDKEAFMSLAQVCAEVGFSRSKIYELVEEGRFPKPIKSDSRTFWLRSQVNAWKRAKVAENMHLDWKDKWIPVPRTKGEKRKKVKA